MKTKIGGLIAICILAVLSLGAIGGFTMGTLNEIAGFEFRSINEANYFKVAEYDIQDTEGDVDVQIDVTEDGVIFVEGKHKGDEALELQVATIVLEKGEYVLKSNAKRTGEDRYQLVLRDVAEGKIVADTEFTVEETTTYTAYIVIQPDVKVDTKFSPVLVEDGEKTNFYTHNWNIFAD